MGATRTLVACAMAAAWAALGPAHAADFYKDKTINFIIPSAAGGGYDAYSRLITMHIGKHLAGQPNVIAQNMPGAGGTRAANFLYNIAPKDGTTIGMVDQSIHLNQILGAPELKADATKFNWIGRILDNSAVLFAWHDAPVKKIQDAFSTELIVSTSGAASKLNWAVLNNLLGMKFRLITGYKGTSDSRLAMERGEVNALSMPWSLLKVEGAELLRDRKINLLLQTGADKNAELQDVPRMIDLARNDEERQILELFSSPAAIGRSVVAPPGLPPERVAELRAAFWSAIQSPALLADVQRFKLELDPLPGDKLQSSVGSGAFSPAVIARARAVAEAGK
ncbi:MAG: Bug family tripartite tricarboxylate transporter substrate binding protein [Gemmatimonas sp.]